MKNLLKNYECGYYDDYSEVTEKITKRPNWK